MTGDRPGIHAVPSLSVDFGALFKSCYRTLWLVAFSIVRDAGLAEDVVQESALIALGKMNEFRAGSSFDAWMGRIVQYVALNQARAKRRRSMQPVDSAPPPAVPITTQPNVGQLELLAQGQLSDNQELFDDRVMAALKRLAHVPRTCLLLRTVGGLDYTEIARVLRIPEGTAMSHVHRTRQLLRRELADLEPAQRGGRTDT